MLTKELLVLRLVEDWFDEIDGVGAFEFDLGIEDCSEEELELFRVRSGMVELLEDMNIDVTEGVFIDRTLLSFPVLDFFLGLGDAVGFDLEESKLLLVLCISSRE